MTYGSSPLGNAPHSASGATIAGVPAEIPEVSGYGEALLVFLVSGVGWQGADGSSTGAGVCAIDCTATGSGAHGVNGAALGGIGLVAGGVAVHQRYELRGEVREGGVLVNRSVRAYLRSTGALTGQADTVAGKFIIATRSSFAEHYITPIDLSNTAADWLPPTANRILPVLAQDTA